MSVRWLGNQNRAVIHRRRTIINRDRHIIDRDINGEAGAGAVIGFRHFAATRNCRPLRCRCHYGQGEVAVIIRGGCYCEVGKIPAGNIHVIAIADKAVDPVGKCCAGRQATDRDAKGFRAIRILQCRRDVRQVNRCILIAADSGIACASVQSQRGQICNCVNDNIDCTRTSCGRGCRPVLRIGGNGDRKILIAILGQARDRKRRKVRPLYAPAISIGASD